MSTIRTDKFVQVEQNIASNMKQRRLRMDAIDLIDHSAVLFFHSVFKLLKQGKMSLPLVVVRILLHKIQDYSTYAIVTIN